MSNRDATKAKKPATNPLLPPRFRQKARKPLKKKPKVPKKKPTRKLPPLTPREVERIERYEELQALQRAGKKRTVEFQLLIDNRPPRPPWDKRLQEKRAPKKPPKKVHPTFEERKERIERDIEEKEKKKKERPWRLPIIFQTWKDIKLSPAYIYSSNLTVHVPSLEYLERMMKAYATNVGAKGGFEPEDLVILNHGFILRPMLQSFDRTDAVKQLQDELQDVLPRDSKIYSIAESHFQSLARVSVPIEPPGGLNRAILDASLLQQALVIGLDVFRVHFDTVYWSYYFETQEEVYEKLPAKKKKVSYGDK